MHGNECVTTRYSVYIGCFSYFQVKLAEFSKTPEDFLRKYEELKSKNVRNLDPLVYLLSKLCEDKEVILVYKQQNMCCLLLLGNIYLLGPLVSWI